MFNYFSCSVVLSYCLLLNFFEIFPFYYIACASFRNHLAQKLFLTETMLPATDFSSHGCGLAAANAIRIAVEAVASAVRSTVVVSDRAMTQNGRKLPTARPIWPRIKAQ